jgi:hypothetical protein
MEIQPKILKSGGEEISGAPSSENFAANVWQNFGNGAGKGNQSGKQQKGS